MYKKILQLTVLCILFILTSCASLLKNTIKDTPVENKIPLHQNPQKGDYAIYKAAPYSDNPQANLIAGSLTTTLEITEVSGDNVYIKESFQSKGIAFSYMDGVVFKIITDKDGNVKKAFLVDHGEEIKLKIAKEGDENYNNYKALSSEDFHKWHVPSKVKVTAGEFETTARYLRKTKSTKNAEHAVYFTNPNVKFCHVASGAIVKKNDEVFECKIVLELIEQGNR